MAEIKIMQCKRHGMTEYVLRKDGSYRCKKCSSESVSERRRKTKMALIEYKGGKCEICGYNKCVAALEFHHLDPSTKDFGISKDILRALDKSKKEVDKCILVCNRCHAEIHYEQWLKEYNEKYCDLPRTNSKQYLLNNEDVQSLIEDKKTYKEIAEIYNVSVSTVKRFVYANNIKK